MVAEIGSVDYSRRTRIWSFPVEVQYGRWVSHHTLNASNLRIVCFYVYEAVRASLQGCRIEFVGKKAKYQHRWNNTSTPKPQRQQVIDGTDSRTWF